MLLPIKDKYTGETFDQLQETESQDVREVIENAKSAFSRTSSMRAYEKYEFLKSGADIIKSKREELAKIITRESGKPLKYSLKEVSRAAFVLFSSAEEGKRIHGETVPMDVEPRGKDRFAYYNRVPIGPVLSITPFNDPLNLVAHKVAPALAAGNSIVNKPTTLAPLSSVKLSEILHEAGMPPNAFQNIITSGNGQVMKSFLQSEEFKKVTFTGGYEAASKLVRDGGVKKYSMELGNNSPVIVSGNSRWEDHIDNIVEAAFESQGQNCIHTQRILIQDSIYPQLTERLIKRTSALKVGNPLDLDTDIGPMITEGEARRVESLISNSVSNGASVLIGNRKEKNVLYPTILENVQKEDPIWKNEIFGPVTILYRYKTLDEAIGVANNVNFGLQAGIITDSYPEVMRAVDKLQFGTVLINDTSDFRIDTMPFGGMKMSGIGREGIKYAIEEMTEIKLVIMKRED
ncbi:MAG: aldehyde dehydrogenase family protein [Thermoplasmataceae archaeon]